MVTVVELGYRPETTARGQSEIPLKQDEEFCFIRPVFQIIHTQHIHVKTTQSNTNIKITANVLIVCIIPNTP